MISEATTQCLREIGHIGFDIVQLEAEARSFKERADANQLNFEQTKQKVSERVTEMERQISILKDLLASPKNFYPGSGVVEMYLDSMPQADGDSSTETKEVDTQLGREG